MQLFFSFLEYVDDLLWSYLAITIILVIGVFFTISSRFYQVRIIIKSISHIKEVICEAAKHNTGIHPIKLYFASIGGMVGLGNLVAVMATVTVGGPGSLLWLWIASFLGMIVKYSEIYLGIRYRVSNSEHGYDGGPMYYLEVAFRNRVVPMIFAVLLCVYGVEVLQFLTLTDTITATFQIDKTISIAVLLVLVLFSAVGGVKRLADVCTAIIPPFMLLYIIIGIWIIFSNYAQLPEMFCTILKSAFVGHAPIGGFVGSTILLAAHYGVSRAVYSGDIGIGYDATVQSETRVTKPEMQARIAVFSLLADSLICTISILIVLLTGVWTIEGLQPSQYILYVLSNYIQCADFFVFALFFVAGFTTISGYFVVGQKCAKFLHHKFGRPVYIIYAVFAFIFFSFHDQTQVMLLMSVSGGMLMVLNLVGVFILRKEIIFK